MKRLIYLGGRMVLGLLLTVCAVAQPALPKKPPAYALTEKAEDGKDYPVTKSTRKVDANSDLLIQFLDLTNRIAEPSQDWLKLSNVLHLVQQVVGERASLQARYKSLDLANPGEVSRLRQDNQEFDTRVAVLFNQWQADLGLTDDAAFTRIRTGAFDGKTNALLIYPNLARWTRAELERLTREAAHLVSNRMVFVYVQAVHLPAFGGARPVHVDENYDSLTPGDYRPIDRLGLRLTPAEQEKLGMEIKMAEQGRDSLKEIHRGAENAGAYASNLLAQVRAAVDRLEDAVKQSPTAWKLKFADAAFLDSLNAMAKNGALTDRQRAAAASNAIWLAEFKTEFEAIGGAILDIQMFKNDLSTSQARSLSDLLSRSGAGMKALDGINTLITTLRSVWTKWPTRASAITANFVELQNLNQLPIDQLWPDEVKKFIAKLGEDFPKTLEIVATARGLLFGDKGMSEVMAIMEGAEAHAIWRNDLAPALLELPRVGLVQDDSVIIKLKYREIGPDGKPGAVLPSDDTYKVKTVLMGLHRKFGASVIYARGLGNTDAERQWKPNVAATVHWFYRSRQEDNVWKRGWNYVNPGFGVHLASLDQGSESVEFGAGLNVSLFDNLLNGGIGLNLNNDERPYVFFGLSLLEALNKAKSAGSGK